MRRRRGKQCNFKGRKKRVGDGDEKFSFLFRVKFSCFLIYFLFPPNVSLPAECQWSYRLLGWKYIESCPVLLVSISSEEVLRLRMLFSFLFDITTTEPSSSSSLILNLRKYGMSDGKLSSSVISPHNDTLKMDDGDPFLPTRQPGSPTPLTPK